MKYVFVDEDVLLEEDRVFGLVLLPHLPQFPSSNWSHSHISNDKDTGKAVFSRAEHITLHGIQDKWHSTVID